MSLTDAQRAEIAAEVATWPPLSAAQRDSVATLFAGPDTAAVDSGTATPKRGRRESVSTGQVGQGLIRERR